jgi:DtxR family Mn-dependent transcriptional regulator
MPHQTPQVSTSVGDYLKAIWMLGGTGSVSTKDLAAQLGVAPASVSEMLGRLNEAGLVEHVPYHGVTLAPQGLKEAMRLVRRHRLIETFLVQHLGYPWDEIHAEAEVLEHAVSDRFIQALDDLLENPSHDPHGDPIPSPDGSLPTTPAVSLAEARPGSRFRVSRLRTQDSADLSMLSGLGLVPGRVVEIASDQPDHDAIVIDVDGERSRIEDRLAALVHGEPV